MFIWLATLLFVAFADTVEDPDVHVLTDANFDRFVAENKMVLLEFYAPWCGHCKNLAPAYSEAATILKEANSEVKLAKIDATVEKKVASAFGVRGYPTLIFYRDGRRIPYDSDRSAQAIVNWLNRKSGPPSTVLTSAQAIADVANQEGTRVVAYLTERDAKAYDLEVALNDLFKDIKFHLVTDESLLGTKQLGQVELYRQGEPVLTIEGFTEAKLKTFLAEEAFPAVSTEEQVRGRQQILPKLPMLLVYTSPSDTTTKDFVEKFATEQKGNVLVAISTAVSAATKLGASGKVLPTAFHVKRPNTNIWNEETEGALTYESLKKFVEASNEGKYESFVKSEPIPTENDGPVTVLVGKTIEQVAFDTAKDVLIEFYAPWCGHCKKLAPIYDELGAAFANDENVVIAKIDATANKIPAKFPVQGFPTLIFVSAGTNTQAPYKGDRTVEAFTKFIQEKRVSKAPAGAAEKAEKEEKAEL